MIFLKKDAQIGDKLWYFIDATKLPDYKGDETFVYAAVKVEDIFRMTGIGDRLAIRFLESTASSSFFFRQNNGDRPFDKLCTEDIAFEILCDDRKEFTKRADEYVNTRLKEFRDELEGMRLKHENAMVYGAQDLEQWINKT